MSAVHTFGRISDAAVLKLIKSLLQVVSDSHATIVVTDRVSLNLSGVEPELEQAWGKLLSSDSYLIQKATLNSRNVGLDITYMRGKTWSMQSSGYENWGDAPSVFIDSLKIDGPLQGEKATEVAYKIAAIIKKHINLAPPAVRNGDDLTAQASAIVNTVTEAVATLVQHTAERQKDLDATRSSLEGSARQETEAFKASLKGLHDARMQELDRREAEIAERSSKLDDRENTHVRRELQRNLAKEVDRRLEIESGLLSKSKSAFQLPVWISMAGVLVLSALIGLEVSVLSSISRQVSAVISSENLSEAAIQGTLKLLDQQNWSIQIRIALQSIALGLLMWFALRFSANRYSTISRWERDLHKFRLDTERAGFLVEGDFEARRISGSCLPQVVLESFSRGLFSSDHDPVDHAKVSDPFSAMVANAVKMSIGPNGVSAEMDRPGIKRARKEAASESA